MHFSLRCEEWSCRVKRSADGQDSHRQPDIISSCFKGFHYGRIERMNSGFLHGHLRATASQREMRDGPLAFAAPITLLATITTQWWHQWPWERENLQVFSLYQLDLNQGTTCIVKSGAAVWCSRAMRRVLLLIGSHGTPRKSNQSLVRHASFLKWFRDHKTQPGIRLKFLWGERKENRRSFVFHFFFSTKLFPSAQISIGCLRSRAKNKNKKKSPRASETNFDVNQLTFVQIQLWFQSFSNKVYTCQ